MDSRYSASDDGKLCYQQFIITKSLSTNHLSRKIVTFYKTFSNESRFALNFEQIIVSIIFLINAYTLCKSKNTDGFIHGLVY